MNEKMVKVEALLKDQTFFKAALAAENEAEVQKLFADNGAELSVEEIQALRDGFIAVMEGRISEEQLLKVANGELSEEELAEAAGGYAPETNAKIVFFGMIGVITTCVATYKGFQAAGIDICKEIKDGFVTAGTAIKDGAVAGYNWVADNITRW